MFREFFQLFTADHYFERYELRFKRGFGFEKEERRDLSMRMPLRFVWGLKPADGGDALDPADKGRMELDPDFDPATPDAQRWMLRFCEDVRRQRFFDASVQGPALSNCFLHTFKEWMDRRCKDSLSGENRYGIHRMENIVPLLKWQHLRSTNDKKIIGLC